MMRARVVGSQRVTATVDGEGKVVDARIDGPAVRMGLDRSSVRAALSWRFDVSECAKRTVGLEFVFSQRGEIESERSRFISPLVIETWIAPPICDRDVRCPALDGRETPPDGEKP
jgi:TonB family protein